MQPLLHWKIIKYYIFRFCVFSLSYVTCKAHVPYYIVIYGLPAIQKFSTFSQKRHDFIKKKVIEREMCVLISSKILSETFLVMR